MTTTTLATLAANAYRTLGLSARADQAAIDAAARRMRVWPDPARVPPTPWDVARFGPVGRTPGDVTRAAALLHEPRSRLEHRLLWYHGHAPPQLRPPPTPSAAPAAAGQAGRHDSVIAALHANVIDDPDAADAARWTPLVDALGAMAADPEYLAWVDAAERDGNFEKRASSAEVAAAVAALPAALAEALADRARAALDRDDVAACARLAALARAGRPEHTRDAVRRLLDGVEDVLTRRRGEMDRDLRDKLETNHAAPGPYYEANGRAALHWSTYYEGSVAPVLALLVELSEGAGDADRVVRARSQCGALLQLLALGWEWAAEFDRAERTLLRALDLARGSAFESGIVGDLDRCRPLAERERETQRHLAARRHRVALATVGPRTRGESGLPEDQDKRHADPAQPDRRIQQPAAEGCLARAWRLTVRTAVIFGAILIAIVGATAIWVEVNAPAKRGPGYNAAGMPPPPPPAARARPGGPSTDAPRLPRVAPEDWVPNPTTNRSITAFGEASREP